jgi:alginate O-acetyltransferase complex protein AlgI
MQFVSLPFFLFLLVVWLLSLVTEARFRPYLLLLSSMFFIAWINPVALGVLIIFSLFTFFTAQWIERQTPYRGLLYASAMTIQVLSLFLLKYVESGSEGLRFLFREAGYRADLVLIAAGFSFYTLQHIGYLTDVFYNRSRAEKNTLHFLLFSAFFPKVQAGPIEQAQKLIPGFTRKIKDLPTVWEGVHRIVLGIFKKMVLADRLAPLVSQVFSSHQTSGSAATVAGVCLFTVQLYFDFSAYSDIAIGSAKLFGIELKENFNFPFSATSVSEFWRRWHMSLIAWFGIYVFNPIAFRLRKNGMKAIITGICFTFLLSGLWHGIGNTFFIWSLLHVLYLVYETLTKNLRLAWSHRIPVHIYRLFSLSVTFLLVSFSNLFFRSADLGQAIQLFKQLGSSPFLGQGFRKGFLSVLAGGGYQEALFNLGVTIACMIVFLLSERALLNHIRQRRWAFTQSFLLLFLIFIFGVFSKADYFIYLQF